MLRKIFYTLSFHNFISVIISYISISDFNNFQQQYIYKSDIL